MKPFLDGTVIKIYKDFRINLVEVEFYLSPDQIDNIHCRVQLNVFPEKLAKFGMPIRLTLDDTGNPVFGKRKIILTKIMKKDNEKMDKLIESL